MKKQFFRVKQLADQTFSRAGKTEALSDDLQDAERRVEFIRTICQNAGKKLTNPGTGGQDSAAREKRLKKNAEYCLGISMLESASSEDDHLLRQVVTDCGKLQMCLANAIVDHEMKVESNIVNPLLGVCDTDYPNVMKVKRNLSKLILDMDSARTRYQQAMKHGGASGAGSKIDSIRDELEEAETKVEQCRDNLACEMLQLIARESELSMTILEYARLQKNYHQTAVAILDEIIPEMETAIGESFMRPVFGRPLEEHLRVTGRKIAFPIELCVCGLLELGIAEEGLFRVAPSASKLRRMKLSLDAHCIDFESALTTRDPHVFAGVLKSYLRELPEPLLTHQLYEHWINAAKIMLVGNQEDGLQATWKVLHSLPQANFDNLSYLIKFFTSLASNKHTNKMNPQNIAIVIAPNLIWSPNEDSNNIGQNMTTANLHTVLVDTLITFSDWFFPGEVDFYVTLSKDVGNFLNGHNSNENQSTSDQEMKRTHSNDSLSDPHSPPQGSPKPAIRSRKKPTAPNPPGHQPPAKEDTTSKATSSNSEKSNRRNSRDLTKTTKEKPPREKSDEKIDKSKLDKSTSPRQVIKDTDNVKIEKEDDIKVENKTEITDSVKDLEKEFTKLKDLSVSKKNSDVTMDFGSYDARRGSSGVDLNRRSSKSGEDVRGRSGGGAEAAGGGGGGTGSGGGGLQFCTLRKQQQPPRPLPRTLVGGGGEGEKPVVPERPPQLQRPLSFRLPKSPDQQANYEERNISLERTHMYSVEKQQVAIVQVNPDKVPNDKTSDDWLGGDEPVSPVGEKPEKPKKPESLGHPLPGHHRAASEGSIIDPGIVSSRPPRPTPPPPPVLTSPKKESTDL